MNKQSPITISSISGSTNILKTFITTPKLPPSTSGFAMKATYGAISPILANSTTAKNKNKNIINGNAFA